VGGQVSVASWMCSFLSPSFIAEIVKEKTRKGIKGGKQKQKQKNQEDYPIQMNLN